MSKDMFYVIYVNQQTLDSTWSNQDFASKSAMHINEAIKLKIALSI